MLDSISIADDYYLVNFEALVRHVNELYSDLLSVSELIVCRAFLSLPKPSRCLYVRLLMRKGALFRTEKLHYAEIPDIDDALAHLHAANFIAFPDHLDINDCLGLFNKAEWLDWLRNRGQTLNPATSRSIIVEAVMNQCPEQFNVENQTIVKLNHQELWELYQVLYFGNLRQELTEFIVTDLGHIQYPVYKINRNTRKFIDREEVNQTIALSHLRESLSPLKDLTHSQLQALFKQLRDSSEQFSLMLPKLNALLFDVARQIERCDPQSAVDYYRQIDTDAALERLIRIHIKSKDYPLAYELCSKALGSDIHTEFALFVELKQQFLDKKLGKVSSSHSKHVIPSQRITAPKNHASVERAACDALAAEGDVYYVENSLIHCMFSLCYWPVLYADVVGAFSHPYQHRPHDLYHADFLKKRAAIKGQCDAGLLNGPDLQQWEADFYQYAPLRSALGYWGHLSFDLIQRALAAISTEDLLKIFNRMWVDLRFCRSGFPDLVLFSAPNHYEFIEVKGPGDNLRPNQTLWLKFFIENRIPARVLHLDWH